METFRLLKIPQACERRGAGRSKYYVETNGELLPALVKFGRQTLVPESELSQVLALRTAGAQDDEVRALVRLLVENRKKALSSAPPTVAMMAADVPNADATESAESPAEAV